MGQWMATEVEVLPPAETTAADLLDDSLLSGLHATGWDIPPGLTLEQWEERLLLMAAISRRSPWALGDALNYGELAYGETYATIADKTGYDPQSLMNMKYIASRWPKDRRHDQPGARWAHHRALASMTPEQADRWLEKSIEQQWSTAQLHEALRAAKAITDAKEEAIPWGCLKCGLNLAQLRELSRADKQPDQN